MRDEYDIEKLNPRKNPYAEDLNESMMILIEEDNYDYFRELSDSIGIPLQKLINFYFADCKKRNIHPELLWN